MNTPISDPDDFSESKVNFVHSAEGKNDETLSTLLAVEPSRDSNIITEFTERRHELTIVLRRLVRYLPRTDD